MNNLDESCQISQELSNNDLAQAASLLNTSGATSTTANSEIYWNDQNDDIILQNLFANTLLSDDFSKKTDFDLGLGFDNLQLNYTDQTTSSVSSGHQLGNESDSVIVINTSVVNADTARNTESSGISKAVDSQQSNNHHLINHSIQQQQQQLETNTGNSNGNSSLTELITLTSINASKVQNEQNLPIVQIQTSNKEPLLTIQDLRLDKGHLADSGQLILSNHLNINESNAAMTKSENDHDENLFKKPQSTDFITLTTLNQNNNDARSELFIPSKDLIDLLSASTPSIKNGENVTSGSSSSNSSKKLSNNSAATHISKMKDSGGNSKLKKTASRKRASKLLLNNLNSGNIHAASGVSNGVTGNISENSMGKKSSQQEKKIDKLKQSRFNNTGNTTNNSVTGGNSSTSSISFLSPNMSTQHKKPSSQSAKMIRLKVENNNSKFMLSLNGNGAKSVEPLSKKFAGGLDTTTSSTVSNVAAPSASNVNEETNDLSNDRNVIILQQNLMKKDELVDLHIKELSLLDLHSSEDDSVANSAALSGDFSINRVKIKKTLQQHSNFSSVTNSNANIMMSNSSSLISSNSSSTSSLITAGNFPVTNFILSNKNNYNNNNNNNNNNNVNHNNNFFNEIITKRIKYSPASSSSSATTLINHQQPNNTNASSNNVTLKSIATNIATNHPDSSNTNENATTSTNSVENEPQMNSNRLHFLSKSLDLSQHQSPALIQNDGIGLNLAKHDNSAPNENEDGHRHLFFSPLSPPTNLLKKKRKKKDNNTHNSSSHDNDDDSNSFSNNSYHQQHQHQQLSHHHPMQPSKVLFDRYNVSMPVYQHQQSLDNSYVFEMNGSVISSGNLKMFSLFDDDNNDTTLQNMKNLDLNTDRLGKTSSSIEINPAAQLISTMQHQTPPSSSTSSLAIQLSEPNTHSPSSLNNKTVTHQQDITLNLNDINARNYLWDLLRTHSTVDELVDQFGSILHNKITFWDLAQLKLKYSRPNNHLKTTYQIIDDYTVLYSNMRTYLERFVNDQASTSGSAALSASNNSNIGSSSSRKSDNSSRSRSSSRNPRKQSTGSVASSSNGNSTNR